MPNRPAAPLVIDDSERETLRALVHTHDYERHGTTQLFAALEVGTGRVTAQARARHTGADFLALLRTVERAYPDGDLHVVLDNVSTHKTPAVRAWFAERPRITFHFTPPRPPG